MQAFKHLIGPRQPGTLSFWLSEHAGQERLDNVTVRFVGEDPVPAWQTKRWFGSWVRQA